MTINEEKYQKIKKFAKAYKKKLFVFYFSDNDSGIVVKKLRQYERRAVLFLSIEKPAELTKVLGVDYDLFIQKINFPVYKEYYVPKKKGGFRIIQAPCKELKIIQKKLNLYLQAYYNIIKPSSSFGFSKKFSEKTKTSIVDNASLHCGKKYVLNVDIKDFFLSIRALRVKQLFMSSTFSFNENIATALTLLATYKGIIPTGSPCSPAISNFICIKMDVEMEELCKENNIAYSRYADDLSFSSDEPFCPDFILDIIRILKENGFNYNPKKYRLQGPGSRQIVTGLCVNVKPNINRKLLKKIRAIIHDFEKNGIQNACARHFAVKSNPSPELKILFYNRIIGYLNFISQVRGKEDPIFLRLTRSFLKATEKHLV